MVIACSKKNSIAYVIWYNIKLCLLKYSFDSIAPQINCQEVIYLFRRKIFLFYHVRKSILPHHLTLCFSCQETRKIFNVHMNNYRILCFSNIFQVIKNCLFYLNIYYMLARAFTVILSGSYFSISFFLFLATLFTLFSAFL